MTRLSSQFRTNFRIEDYQNTQLYQETQKCVSQYNVTIY